MWAVCYEQWGHIFTMTYDWRSHYCLPIPSSSYISHLLNILPYKQRNVFPLLSVPILDHWLTINYIGLVDIQRYLDQSQRI